MSRVTRSSTVSALKRQAPNVAAVTAPTSRKRTKKDQSATASVDPATMVDVEELKEEVKESDAKAEAEGVLLHPALTFRFSDARAHLTAADARWGPVMDKLKCKPYEGEQKEAFNPFRSLTTSIIGQQVSWMAARSINHKFVRVFYPHLPEKLPAASSSAPTEVESPFPTPAEVMALKDPTPTLRAAGLSGRKVEYVIELAARFHDGRLNSKKLWDMDDEEVTKTLLEVRGIGIWTVQMFLMFSMRRPDVLPVGDLGLQKGLCRWYLSDASSHLAIHPRKLVRAPTPDEGDAYEMSQPSASASQPPATPMNKALNSVDAYPTPSTPSLETLEAVGDVELSSQQIDELPPPASQYVFPTTSNGLTAATLKTRLNGKKLKGNVYLTPTEMEELTDAWRPYRSVGCWYLWSITDGTGDP